MGREERSFDQAYREFLPQEQRREVLKALREKLDPGTTFGEIVDAARSLGWEDALGEVLLSELASTLLGEAQPDTSPHDASRGTTERALPSLSGRARQLEAAIVEGLTNWSEDEEEPLASDEQDSDWEAAPVAKRSSKKRSSKKKSSKKRASKKKAAAKKRGSKKKASKKRSSKKKASKKRTAKKTASKKRVSKKRAAKKKTAKKRSAKKRAAKASTSKRAAKTRGSKKASKKRGKKKSTRRRG